MNSKSEEIGRKKIYIVEYPLDLLDDEYAFEIHEDLRFRGEYFIKIFNKPKNLSYYSEKFDFSDIFSSNFYNNGFNVKELFSGLLTNQKYQSDYKNNKLPFNISFIWKIPHFNPYEISVSMIFIEPLKNFLTLPQEMYLEILSYFSIKEILSIGLTSKFFQKIANNQWLWKTFFIRDFKLKRSLLKKFAVSEKDRNNVFNWKLLYKSKGKISLQDGGESYLYLHFVRKISEMRKGVFEPFHLGNEEVKFLIQKENNIYTIRYIEQICQCITIKTSQNNRNRVLREIRNLFSENKIQNLIMVGKVCMEDDVKRIIIGNNIKNFDKSNVIGEIRIVNKIEIEKPLQKVYLFLNNESTPLQMGNLILDTYKESKETRIDVHLITPNDLGIQDYPLLKNILPSCLFRIQEKMIKTGGNSRKGKFWSFSCRGFPNIFNYALYTKTFCYSQSNLRSCFMSGKRILNIEKIPEGNSFYDEKCESFFLTTHDPLSLFSSFCSSISLIEYITSQINQEKKGGCNLM